MDIPLVVGIGNPNMDFIVQVTNDNLLVKYDLVTNSQSKIPYETLLAIIDDIQRENYFSVRTAGGCTQNSLTVLKWLCKSRIQTVMLGAVGKDNNAEILRKIMKKSGVVTEYVEVDNHKTTEVVILTGQRYRTAVSYVDAGRMFTLDHLVMTDRFTGHLNKSDIILTEGFFVARKPEVCNYIMNRYRADKIILFNIATAYIFDDDASTVDDIIDFSKRCDIVIGNRTEFKAMTDKAGLSDIDNIIDSMKRFYRLMRRTERKCPRKKLYDNWEKILIVTGDDRPVYFIYEFDDVLIQNVYRLNDEHIVDTTGAGDSFVAGFLYGLVNDYDVRKSVRTACKVAAEFIKRHGVSLPDREIDTSEPAILSTI